MVIERGSAMVTELAEVRSPTKAEMQIRFFDIFQTKIIFNQV
ncbi:MAG: hypothetical protein ACK40K_01295 [Raineya sp.]